MLINIDRGNGIEQMDTSLLTDTSSVVDNDNEYTAITEYQLNGVTVHRSVHVHLKQGLKSTGISGGFI